MGIHEWSYDSQVTTDLRYKVPHAEKKMTLKDRKKEVELGFDLQPDLKKLNAALTAMFKPYSPKVNVLSVMLVWMYAPHPASPLQITWTMKMICAST